MAESIETIITVYKAQVESYTKEIDAIIKKVRELTGIEDQQTKNAAVGARSLTDSATQRKKLLNDEIANLKKLQEQSKKAFTVPEVQSFNSQILQSKNNIALLKGETASLGNVTSGLKNQFAQVGAGILAAFSVNALKNFSVEAINVSAQFQAIRNAIDFTQGSAAKGAETFQFLQDISEEMGLELTSTAQSFKLFSASAQLSGVSADETKRIFTSVATAVTAMGLSADDAQGVFLALSQIIAKGTVSSEELRGQIGERLPGAFNIAAKSIGVTTGELYKMLSAGQVVSADFLPKFATELQKTFEGALPKAVESTQANLNRLSNVFTNLKITLGDFIGDTGLLSGLTDFFEGLDTALKSRTTIIEESAKRTITTLTGQLQSEGDAILEARIKQNADFEKFNPLEKEKFIADERIKILNDFKEKLIKNQQEIAELTPDTENFNASIRKEAVERIETLTRENSAIETLTASKAKDNVVTEEQINTVIKLKKELEFLNVQLNTLPLDKFDKVINVKKQQELLKEIERIQKAIDDITGKTSEERIKAAEDLRKKLIDEEKKTVDAINKLRIELAPTEEEKVLIKAGVDQKSLETAADDFRTLAQIQKDIDTNKITFLRLNALKLLADLKAIDDKRLEDIRKGADDTIKAANDARLKQLQDELRGAQEQVTTAQELQAQVDRARLASLQEGSQERFDAQKDILTKLADQEIIANLGNAKKIEEIELRLQNDINDLDREFSQKRIDNARQTFETIAGFAREFVGIFTDLERAKSDAVIEGLEKQRDEQEAAFDKETDSLQEARDKRLISEKEFEDRSAKLKDQRIASEKKINEAIKAEKRKQAEIAKAVAIFEATLNFAQAIIVALSAAPPPFNVVLAAISAALAGVQLAAVIATPIPTFAKGTKDKKKSGMAIVGERGQELVHLPSAAQVLPAPQTKKNREAINAMFDNNLDEYVRKKYVQPELQKEKLSTQKKYEILKQVYEKQAVENYNKSVQEKYELTRTNALNNIVNNYVNNIISNEQFNSIVDKKVYETIVKRKDELSQVLSEAKISHSDSFINNEIKKTISSEINQTLLKNIVYNSGFEKSINTNYVSAVLEENRSKLESKKQEAFAQNIANSFMLSNQTNFDNEKIQVAVENGFRAATKRGVFMRNFEQLAETIADKINPDFRKM